MGHGGQIGGQACRLPQRIVARSFFGSLPITKETVK
jgi:hypothetical protein